MVYSIPQMATIKATAKAFGLPENFVRQKAIRGEIVAVRAGRKYLINQERFAEYLNTAQEAAPISTEDFEGIVPVKA